MAKNLNEIFANTPNINWEFIDKTAINDAYNLISKIEREDNVSYRTEKNELEEIFTTNNIKCVGGYDDNGKLLAYGIVKLKLDKKTVYCYGGVDLSQRGNGVSFEMVHWFKQTGYELLKKNLDNGFSKKLFSKKNKCKGNIIVEISDSREDLRIFLMELGFLPRNRFFELRKKLDSDNFICDDDITLPPFINIINWKDDYVSLLNKNNDTFNLEKNMHPFLPLHSLTNINKDWSQMILDKSTDRTKVIGYIVASKYEQDWEVLKHKESYIDFITLSHSKYQNEMMKALLHSHIENCKANSLDCVAIGIEPDNQPDLYEILKELDFTISSSSTEFINEVLI